MLKSMINPDSSGKKRNLVLGFMLIMLLAMTTNLMAANEVVSNTNDSGAGSLRWAITYVGVGDEITFSITGTIILTSEELAIDKNMTITGPGADQLSIDGNNSSRIFLIDDNNPEKESNVTITGLTITNGNAYNGGGIYNYSDNLTLENCTISGNSTANDGGGIYNDGVSGTSSPTLTNCTINGNSADFGGGIYNYGILGTSSPTLTNCTISGNSATHDGGGVYNYGISGTSNPTLTNCTISGNSAEKGGGMVGYDSGLYIKNTILANNTATTNGPDYYKSGGSVTDIGYNIVEYSYNYTWVGTGDITGNQTNLNLSSTLEDNNTLNGTQTLKTTSGSVAINAGDPDNIANNGVAIPTTDQRGAERNGATDIGAYEYWDDAGSLPVTLSAFTAQFIENTPTLYWTTQSETDNMGWFVYRNVEEDFTTSEKISEFIEGHGTTTQQQSYIYEDRIQNPQVGDTYYYWLESIDYSGIVNHYDKVAILTIPDIHNPDTHVAVPSKYGLQSGPNPFNSNLTVSYMLPQTDMVRIEIYNMYGQLIAQFNEGLKTADKKHTLEWDGKDIYGHSVSSGVLLIKLITSEGSETKKAILLR